MTEEQLAVIQQLISDNMSRLTIRIDSGNIDPNAEEPEVPYIPLRPSEIPHEELGGLLGGTTHGHYHLTEAELLGLIALMNALMPDGENVEFPDMSKHEELLLLYGVRCDD